MANLASILSALINGAGGYQQGQQQAAAGSALHPPQQPQAPVYQPPQQQQPMPAYQPPSVYMPSQPQAASPMNAGAPQIPSMPSPPPLAPSSPGQNNNLLNILGTLMGANKSAGDDSSPQQNNNNQGGPLPQPSSGGTPVQIALPSELPSSGGAPYPGPKGGPVPIQQPPQQSQAMPAPHLAQSSPLSAPQMAPQAPISSPGQQQPQQSQQSQQPQQPQQPQGGGLSLQQAVAAIKSRNPGISDANLFGAITKLSPLLDMQSKQQLAQAHLQLQQQQVQSRQEERQEDRSERRDFHQASIKERQSWHASLEKRDQRQFKALKTDYDNATRYRDTVLANGGDAKRLEKADKDVANAQERLNKFADKTEAPGHFGDEPEEQNLGQTSGEGTQDSPIMAQTQEDIDNAPSGSVISVDGQLFTKP